MPKTEKIERVAELAERVREAQALLLTEYRGLSVADMTELRRTLGERGARFAVVKNTLMRRAVSEAGVPDLAELLEGPSAVAFVAGDPVAAAKAIKTAARRHPTLALKGGYLDGQVLDAEAASALADLASREEMLAQVAGLLQAGLASAARVLRAAPSQILSLFEAYQAKLPTEASGPTTKEE
ncbi:MAG: 50S ribosomal protein L10 [Actinomycetota bacterium]|jgi:large subunit ribosomal protein L10|nr:MAG: 50S ribosomal protein L10 [Actinomycetota bacterium]